MDATTFFDDTDFSNTGDGGIVCKPSMWVNFSYIINRVLAIVGLITLYIWIYPRFNLSIYFLIVPVLVISFTILNIVVITRFVEYEIKGDKLIFREGFFNRHSGAVNIARIQNTDVKQSMIEQFFGIGTVTVVTDDSTASLIWMLGMKKPDQLRAALLEASEAVRKSRGIYEFVRS